MGITILVTGCCGYIGSHTCVELLLNGYEVVGIEDFSNSDKSVPDIIEKITNKHIHVYEGNVLDCDMLETIFKENKIDGVIDFAAYKSVGDSISNPIDYYINNVSSLLILSKIMKKHGVKSLIFSSTAAVYGQKEKMPITELDEIGNTTNPYGTSKLFDEKILKDIYLSDKTWNICIFRYFNPVGAHKSGQLGENPKGIPSNLMPKIVNAAKNNDIITIYGNNYNTYDGTGVRDYIHVVDLAKAHIKGIDLVLNESGGYNIYNLGTGRGYSVFDIINTFEKVNNVSIKYHIGEKRCGDVSECYASALKVERELGWKAELGLEEMCKDAYNASFQTE